MSETPVRILHACTVGISARAFLLPILKRLQAEGYDVCFACRDDEDARFVAGHGVPFFPVYISRGFSFLDLFALVKLYRFIRRRRFHVVHTHTTKAGFVARLAAWLARVPRILCTQHGFVVHPEQSRCVRFIYTTLERWIGRHTDQYITVTDRVRTYLIELGMARPDNTCRIYNGIDFGRFNLDAVNADKTAALRTAWGCDAGTVVVGSLSRLVPDKGIEDLIDAFGLVRRTHANALLVIAGDGEMKDTLQRRVNNLGIADAVRFIGWQQDVPQILVCFDLFCLPTIREGFGYAFLEAQAMGVPVVATDIEPLTETMVDGETALLVPVKSPEAIAAALSSLIGNSALRATLGANGCARVRSLFDLRVQLDETMQFYRRALEPKS